MPVLAHSNYGKKFDPQDLKSLTKTFNRRVIRLSANAYLIDTADEKAVSNTLQNRSCYYNVRHVKSKQEAQKHLKRWKKSQPKKLFLGLILGAAGNKDQTRKSIGHAFDFDRASRFNFGRFADTFNQNAKIFGAVGIAIPLLCGTIWMGSQIIYPLLKMEPYKNKVNQAIEDNLGYTPRSGAWTETNNAEKPEVEERAPSNE